MKSLIPLIFLLGIVGCVPQNMIAKEGMLPGVCQNFKAEESDELGDTLFSNRTFWQAFDHYYKDKSPRKLVVFMDGTGNDKTKHTNVRKLYRLAVEQACSGVPVVPYYDKGVGAKWFDRIRGGVAGRGTGLNIRQAYRFLVESYKPNDEIYLVGFSRGAFTARSLNGLIEFAGLVDRASIEKKWYEVLNLPTVTNLHFTVYDLYETYHKNYDGKRGFEQKLQKELEDVIVARHVKTHSPPVEVSAIGIFDTVPALGIFRDDEPDDHRLELYAKMGFHALAIDEQRDDFRLLRFDPFRKKLGSELQEVWFSGVHSDIGGSYSRTFDCQLVLDDERKNYRPGLGAATLNWMLSNFEETGIFPARAPYQECSGGSLHDEFLARPNLIYDWMYNFFTLGTYPRVPRPGDWVHRSVIQRLQVPALEDPHPYREVDPETGKQQYYFLGTQGASALERYFTLDANRGVYRDGSFLICDPKGVSQTSPTLTKLSGPVSSSLTRCSFKEMSQ